MSLRFGCPRQGQLPALARCLLGRFKLFGARSAPFSLRQRALLRPGGVLIYETFMLGNEQFGKPSSPDFLLAPGELLKRCEALQIAAFEQGVVTTPRAAAIQRICAVQGASGVMPLP